MFQAALLTSLVLCAAAAAALPPAPAAEPASKGEGRYALKKGDLTVKLAMVYLEDGRYAGHLVAFRAGGECIDSWAGFGMWSEAEKVVGLTSVTYLADKATPKQAPKEQVFLAYNPQRNTYSVRESDNLSHGLNCTFQIGDLPAAR